MVCVQGVGLKEDREGFEGKEKIVHGNGKYGRVPSGGATVYGGEGTLGNLPDL